MLSALPILIVIILILLNGVFVAAEFALLGAPRASIERLAKFGNKKAVKLRQILSDRKHQDRYIATAQLGITLSSLGLGMYGEHMLAVWLESRLTFLPLPSWIAAHSIASLVAIVFLTYLHIVIGEMVPKSLALQKAEETAFRVETPMRLVQLALFPLVLLLNGIGNFILRIIGMRRSGHDAGFHHTSDELEFVIKESEKGGMLRKATSEVLQDLLEFGDLTAREVMVPRVKIVGIPLGVHGDDLVQILFKATHTRYLVFDETIDRIVGSIHIKDFLRNRISKRPIEKTDARPVPFVPEAASLEQVLRTMRSTNAQIVAVLDEYGGTAGLITIEDLFEEIVGDIDESELPSVNRSTSPAGVFVIAGMLRLDEASDLVEVDLSSPFEVDTVGGLILSLLGRPPRTGDLVEYKGVLLEVTEIDGYAVGRCKIKKK